jgi:hypothetical protein
MPPYENQSLHDMHALMQQLDTLNAAHAPEHLEMFEGMTNAAKSMYKAGNDMVLSNTNRATEEEVILYEYSKHDKKEDKLNLLLMSSEIQAKFDELLKDMVKSSTFKPLIMKNWYPKGIPETKQREVYAAMHPPKK